MKKSNSIVLILSLFVLFGCSKDDAIDDSSIDKGIYKLTLDLSGAYQQYEAIGVFVGDAFTLSKNLSSGEKAHEVGTIMSDEHYEFETLEKSVFIIFSISTSFLDENISEDMTAHIKLYFKSKLVYQEDLLFKPKHSNYHYRYIYDTRNKEKPTKELTKF